MEERVTTYGIREESHYQGCSPGPVLAATASRDEAYRWADDLSTCSFCSPGRTSRYSTGRCIAVVKTSRPAGYISGEAGPDVREVVTGLAE